MQKREEITICSADSHCYEPMQKLCDARYGTGYFSKSRFDRWMQNSDLFLQAQCGGEFAGFAVLVPSTPREVAAHMHMPREDVLAAADGKPVLIYQSAAVLPRFEGRGIMRQFAVAGLGLARGLGYGAIFASAWVNNGKIPMEHTFQQMGFQALYRKKLLWYDDENYHCVTCGGRCRCDGIIYQKIL